ncbi:MAG: glutathione S-transferase family protein [Rhizobiaceae bacterium]
MKLLYAGASPYVSKAALAANLAGIDVEHVTVDSTNGDPVLDAANPLSKIPCLVLDDGTGVYDSRAITRYLDRLSGGKLYPTNADALTKAERTEALCDGINDCAVGYMYEARFRPEEKIHEPWRERMWGKAERGLDAVMADLPPNGASEPANIASLSLSACLGYLDLRFTGKWQDGRDDLVAWRDQFDAAHPELVGLKPHA